MDWADFGRLLIIVSYNWPEIIRKRDSLAILSSLRLIGSKKAWISSAGSDVALNAPVIILLALPCIV